MQDVNGKTIAGYRFGPYWFGIDKAGGHGERIHGLSGGSFISENDLIGSYDRTLGNHADSPKLIRVYEDGTELQLRPKGEPNEV